MFGCGSAFTVECCGESSHDVGVMVPSRLLTRIHNWKVDPKPGRKLAATSATGTPTSVAIAAEIAGSHVVGTSEVPVTVTVSVGSGRKETTASTPRLNCVVKSSFGKLVLVKLPTLCCWQLRR